MKALEYEFTENYLFCKEFDLTFYGERESSLQKFHIFILNEFTRLWKKPNREKSVDEKNLWKKLREYIDLDEYLYYNPIPQTIKARILSKKGAVLIVSQFGFEEAVARYDISTSKSKFYELKENDWFEGQVAEYGTGRTEWFDVNKISAPYVDKELINKVTQKINDNSDFSETYLN